MSSTAFLEIRQENVGKIIGKGGSRIKQIENDSFARVRVNKAASAGEYVTVEVCGNEKAIESAKRLIGDIADYRVRDSNTNDSVRTTSVGASGWGNGASRDSQRSDDRSQQQHANRNNTSAADARGWGSGANRDNQRSDDRSQHQHASRTDNSHAAVHENDRESAWDRASWQRKTSGWQTESTANSTSLRQPAAAVKNASTESRGEERWDDEGETSTSTPMIHEHSAESHVKSPPAASDGIRYGWGSATLNSDTNSRSTGWGAATSNSHTNSGSTGWGASSKNTASDMTTSCSNERSSGWATASAESRGRYIETRKREHQHAAEDSDEFASDLESPKKLADDIMASASASASAPPSKFSSWTAIRANMKERAAARWADLAPIIKNFYFEDPEVSVMTAEEVDTLRRENNNVMVQDLAADGDRKRLIPSPVRTFQQAFAHHPDLLAALLALRFERPSPIQAQAWPILLSGLDMIGIAQTGTGKTLAFLLPAFVHIEGQSTPRDVRSREGPSALVLTPTRELALQIDDEVRKLNYHGMRCCCVYGGGSRKQQVDVVASGVDFIVATPGRLDDLIMSNVVSLRHVTYLILDEADRMLDLGFEPQINKILLDVRPDRQTVMTSATWPPGVRRLVGKYTKNPIQVFVGTLDLQACVNVKQVIDIVNVSDKRQRLIDFLRAELDPSRDKVIVFVDRKVTVDDLASDLALLGIACDVIHGDRVQSAREQALADFRTGATRVLLATDVASRGLDIRDVTHVFNYALPKNMEDYVHRVGRTGRAGRFGTAITLVTREDWRQAAELVRILEQAKQEVPRALRDMAVRYDEMLERRKFDRSTPSYGHADRSRSYNH